MRLFQVCFSISVSVHHCHFLFFFSCLLQRAKGPTKKGLHICLFPVIVSGSADQTISHSQVRAREAVSLPPLQQSRGNQRFQRHSLLKNRSAVAFRDLKKIPPSCFLSSLLLVDFLFLYPASDPPSRGARTLKST